MRVIEDAFPSSRAALLGESPHWSRALSTLVWIDMVAGKFFTASNGKVQIASAGQPVMAIVQSETGNFRVVLERAISDWPNRGGATHAGPLIDKVLRFNDAAYDPAGRLWVGTTRLDGAEGGGALGFLAFDGSFRPVVTSMTLPNGIAWSPAGDRIYVVDSGAGIIFCADFAALSGEVGPLRPFACPDQGVPDGLCMCVDGSVWVAHWDGGRVSRYDADGQLADMVRLPVTRPTSCAVDEAGALYVTTASYGLAPEVLAREPLAGRVLRLPDAGPPGHDSGWARR